MGHMLNAEDLKKLHQALISRSDIKVKEAMQELGRPSAREIVECALAGLKSADRNVRALMVRILARYPEQFAAPGVLEALGDKQRRVREAAVRSSGDFLHFPGITARLQAMIADEKEKTKIRKLAFGILSGAVGELPQKELPAASAEALKSFLGSEKYRSQVLFGLLQLDLSPRVEELLRQFVKEGSKEEAVMATRALCGFKVINLGTIADEAQRRHVARSCEPAAGRVFYWVRRGGQHASNAASEF